MRYLMAVLLIVCAPALADDSVMVQGGWLHTSSSNYGDAGTLSARYEHRLYRELWVGVDGTYHGATERHNGDDDNTFSYGEVSGYSAVGTLAYRPEWAKAGKLEPYVLGGWGWSWWQFEASDRVEALGVQVDLGDSPMYKAAVGTLYRLSDSWSIQAEWAFIQTRIPKEATNADGSPSILLGDDNRSGRITIGEEEFLTTVGLRYEF